jgi:dGTPase
VEAGQVGKALGKAVYPRIAGDLPSHITAADIGSIVQAACLAHDVGNPPFGHAGEEALMHWFDTNREFFRHLPESQRHDLSFFDGNAQGFRILSQTENHIFTGGLRLTYATLASFLKYPRVSAPGIKKFSVFLSEKDILDEVADAVGLPASDAGYLRHPLAYLVEAADDICYCVLDLEDAVELKILPFTAVQELLLKPFDASVRAAVVSTFEAPEMFRVNLARMRGPVFDMLVSAAVEAFMTAYQDIIAGDEVKDLFSHLSEDDARANLITEAKDIGHRIIYTDTKKVEIEVGSFATLDTLLGKMLPAAKASASHIGTTGSLDWKSRSLMGLLGDHAPAVNNAPLSSGWNEYLIYRRVIDFVSGMTDNYATYIAKQLNGMAFSGV